MSLDQIIDDTRTAVSADAAAVFRASGSGVGAVGSTIRVGRHTVVVDEPPALGGDDEAPSPVEFALVGLASCQIVTYRFWAQRLGIPLETIDVEATGDLDVRGFFGLDENTRPGLGDTRVVVILGGPGTPEQYEQLRQPVDQHCPVLDVFRNVAPVSTEVRT